MDAMPVERCTYKGKPAYRWGEHGKCYAYTAGNKRSRDAAKKKALEQGRAMWVRRGRG